MKTRKSVCLTCFIHFFLLKCMLYLVISKNENEKNKLCLLCLCSLLLFLSTCFYCLVIAWAVKRSEREERRGFSKFNLHGKTVNIFNLKIRKRNHNEFNDKSRDDDYYFYCASSNISV